MRIGSLFSGIGLLELGLELSGVGTVNWQCEIDPWCRKVLRKHWTHVQQYEDVKALHPPRTDILCGGFPCQPFSVAGSRKEFSDERWLWPEFARCIEEAAPAIVVAENVPGLRARGLRRVLADLADLGFNAEWTHFRASDIGAPHERNRLWIVATHPERIDVRQQPGWLARSIKRQAEDVITSNANSFGRGWLVQQRVQEVRSTTPNTNSVGRLESAWRFAEQRGWSRQCGWALDLFTRVDDGRPRIVDAGRRRKALGNAVVMPCARAVGYAIMESVL